MAFLGQLADQLGSQFSISENNNKTLDGADGERYGALGDFASKFDQSAERRYLEEGYLRKDAFNIDSKQFEILMSQPQATVLVKKRMLSSVSDNYDLTYMDKDEKLYFRAMKILFQNKNRIPKQNIPERERQVFRGDAYVQSLSYLCLIFL
jgi:hypothetical protein